MAIGRNWACAKVEQQEPPYVLVSTLRRWCSKGPNILLPLRMSWLNIWGEFILTITSGKKWFPKCLCFLSTWTINRRPFKSWKYLFAEYTTSLYSLFRVMPICFMPFRVMPICVIAFRVIPICVMPICVMRFRVTPICVMPISVMPFCVIPFRVMPFRVMPFTTQYAFLHFDKLHDTWNGFLPFSGFLMHSRLET